MDIIRGKNTDKEHKLFATIGMFDGVHVGHQSVLAQTRAFADEMGCKMAVVTFAEHPQKLLRPEGGLKMIMTLDERLRLLEKAGVDVAIVLDFTHELSQLSSKEFMSLLKDSYGVHGLAVGFNHRFGHNRDEDFDDYVRYGEQLGVKVVKAKEYNGECSPVSSSLIRKMIEEGRVDLARCYLSRPFELGGVVVHGKQNGRKIGFPTANIDVASLRVIVPHKGVYAVKATLENGKKYDGMANIGVRPTVEKGGLPTLEVNIFDFDGDIYGQRMDVEFVKFIRSEVKMASFDELKKQLFLDKATCVRVLSENVLKA